MDIEAARNAALNARWASEFLRDFANLKFHGVDCIDHKLAMAKNNLRIACETMGCRMVEVTPPPANVGPDDGLQCDERGDVVGRP